MGKKDKKKKVSGAVKTAAKTEKKLEAKRKKELAEIGEEDIEAIVLSIEKEEAKRLAVVEKSIPSPSPRVSATLVPHPTNTAELVLFGGEYHDGKKTLVYNDLYIYNTSKAEWRVVKAPGAPPPRSAHQAVTLSSNKGEMWVFGGEFTSPSEMQFYHYKDLWVFNFGDRKWEKVDRPNAPSPRSGHRMCTTRRSLLVFGGYHDNGRVYKYLGDLHMFCTDTRVWSKIVVSGTGPSPRSGCLLMPCAPDSLIVYGGYSRTREGKTDKGVTHGDLYRLAPNTKATSSSTTTAAVAGGANASGLCFKWEALKGGPYRPQPPRSSFSACLAPGNKAYVFGGVQDTEDTEETLIGEMFDSLHCLELEGGTWRNVTMRKIKTAGGGSTRRQKGGEEGDEDEESGEESDDGEEKKEPVTVCSDGVFTMTLSSAPATKPSSTGLSSSNTIDAQDMGEAPSARMNTMMAVQKSQLYLLGGLLEKGEKQFTLSDMYCLDLHKLDGWKCLQQQTDLPEWLGSDSEDDEEDGDEDENSGGSDESTDSGDERE